MEQTKYRFNEARHLHQLLVEGEYKNLTGCTTVLSVIAKPALIPWAAKMATEFISSNCDWVKEDVSDGNDGYFKVTENELEEAKKAHTKRKEKAGQWGTITHEEISIVIKKAIAENSGLVTNTETENKGVFNFVDWAIQNKVKFLETERNIYSESLFIGGIVDFVCEIDGEVWIGDIKTSNSGIYPEHFWQIAGYQLMLQEMGMYLKVKGYLVLNLKENGDMAEKRSISNGDNTDAFLAALKIYRIQEKIKNQII